MPEDRPHRSRRLRIIEGERAGTEGAGVIPGGRKAGKGIHRAEGVSGYPSPPLTLGLRMTLSDSDTLPVMAGLVPAIPLLGGAALHPIGITGTWPVMTGGAGVAACTMFSLCS